MDTDTAVVRCADSTLIDLDAACRLAIDFCGGPLAAETVVLGEAHGRVLADSVEARMAMPPFDQSAMDGYAVRAADIPPGRSELKIGSRIAAGDAAEDVASGHAARIFTGAPLPHGFDSVVMQEHVERAEGSIRLSGPIRAGCNVRRQGEDCCPGDPLLSAGHRIDARAVALLAAQGVIEIGVHRRPRIGVLSTGSELRSPGSDPGRAGIYDSNRPMLLAVGRAVGAQMRDCGQAVDDPRAIASTLVAHAEDCDLLVTTGGVSVGEEDHTAAALTAAGAVFTALRIALKPGKPAIVGRIGSCACLCLPGSPAAALAGWHMLGRAMLAALSGQPFDTAPRLRLPLAHAHERRPGRRELAPARLEQTPGGTSIRLIGKAGSGRLVPLSQADGLADIDPAVAYLVPGEVVGFHPFQD